MTFFHSLSQRPGAQARLAAAIVFVFVGVLYLTTMYPGLLSNGDSAKFQYLGRVLGTAHNPGYPLYVWLTFAFSWIPIDSLAFRMNLFSVVCGSAAVAMLALTVRSAGASLGAAVVAAIGLGGTLLYWELSLRAEVYALAALLQVVTLYFLVGWANGRHHFYWLAVGTFALSLGNHLTCLLLLPSYVLFVAMQQPARVTLRRLLPTAFIGVLGLSQYAFILLRTAQGAAHVETRATSVSELVAVLQGRQFSHLLAQPEPGWAFDVRLPELATRLTNEVHWYGLALALLGVISLIRSRAWPELQLIISGFAAALGFLLTYSVVDYEGFLVPALVLVWWAAARGLDQVADMAGRLGGRRSVVAAAAILLLLIFHVQPNVRYADHTARTMETRFFNQLFERLPARAILVSESYAFDQMVLYKLSGEQAAAGRDIRLLPAAVTPLNEFLAQGFRVFATTGGHRRLQDLGFVVAPASGLVGESELAVFPLFEVTGTTGCLEIGNLGWVEVTPLLAAGRGDFFVSVDNFGSFDSVLEIAGLGGAAPRIVASTGPGSLATTSAVVNENSNRDAALRPLWDQAGEHEQVWVMQVVRNEEGQGATFRVDGAEGMRALWMRGTVDRDQSHRLRVCPEPQVRRRAVQTEPLRVPLGSDASGEYLLDGWHDPEPGPVRWTSAESARLVVLREARTDVRVEIDATPLPDPASPTMLVRLKVNGRDVGARVLASRGRLSWDVASEYWAIGLNEMAIGTPPLRSPIELGLGQDGRRLGLQVSSVTLTPISPEGRSAPTRAGQSR